MPHDDRARASCRGRDAEDLNECSAYGTRNVGIELLRHNAADVIGLNEGIEIAHSRHTSPDKRPVGKRVDSACATAR